MGVAVVWHVAGEGVAIAGCVDEEGDALVWPVVAGRMAPVPADSEAWRLTRRWWAPAVLCVATLVSLPALLCSGPV